MKTSRDVLRTLTLRDLATFDILLTRGQINGLTVAELHGQVKEIINDKYSSRDPQFRRRKVAKKRLEDMIAAGKACSRCGGTSFRSLRLNDPGLPGSTIGGCYTSMRLCRHCLREEYYCGDKLVEVI